MSRKRYFRTSAECTGTKFQHVIKTGFACFKCTVQHDELARSAQPGELEHAEHYLPGLLSPLQGTRSSPSLQVRTLFRLFRPRVILYACMMEKTVTKISHLKESSVVVAQNEPLQSGPRERF